MDMPANHLPALWDLLRWKSHVDATENYNSWLLGPQEFSWGPEIQRYRKPTLNFNTENSLLCHDAMSWVQNFQLENTLHVRGKKTMKVLVAQSYLTATPWTIASVHGILQARILE